jgi:hypothetical protein
MMTFAVPAFLQKWKEGLSYPDRSENVGLVDIANIGDRLLRGRDHLTRNRVVDQNVKPAFFGLGERRGSNDRRIVGDVNRDRLKVNTFDGEHTSGFLASGDITTSQPDAMALPAQLARCLETDPFVCTGNQLRFFSTCFSFKSGDDRRR